MSCSEMRVRILGFRMFIHIFMKEPATSQLDPAGAIMARPPRQVNETHVDIEAGCAQKNILAVAASLQAFVSRGLWYRVPHDLRRKR